LDKAYQIALSIGATKEGLYNQVDTYFAVPEGKLKLRQFEEKKGELIAYNRPSRHEAKLSEYHLFHVNQPLQLIHVLKQVLPIEVIVRKERTVLIWENVRIHLDRVEGLGNFIEFEAVLRDGEEENLSRQRVSFLQGKFHITKESLVPVGYYELIKQNRDNQNSLKQNV